MLTRNPYLNSHSSCDCLKGLLQQSDKR